MGKYSVGARLCFYERQSDIYVRRSQKKVMRVRIITRERKWVTIDLRVLRSREVWWLISRTRSLIKENGWDITREKNVASN